MFNANLIVLSYHQFNKHECEYPFSRTYKQFAHDLIHKDFDWITIDDNRSCQIKACEMMQQRNIRAKLFVPTSLVGQDGYCTWEQLWKLKKFHDIGNHSHNHVRLSELTMEDICANMKEANYLIKHYLNITPRFFVPPYNNFDLRVEGLAKQLNMMLIKDRVEIRNNTR
jgi:peptidoglycan/xylan/chitin deacetylase (PgdA/CDA1 family)